MFHKELLTVNNQRQTADDSCAMDHIHNVETRHRLAILKNLEKFNQPANELFTTLLNKHSHMRHGGKCPRLHVEGSKLIYIIDKM